MYVQELIHREHRRIETAAAEVTKAAELVQQWQASVRLATRISAYLAAEHHGLYPQLMMVVPEAAGPLLKHHVAIRRRAADAVARLRARDLRADAAVRKLHLEWIRYALRIRNELQPVLDAELTDVEQRRLGGEMLLTLADHRGRDGTTAADCEPTPRQNLRAWQKPALVRDRNAPWLNPEALPVLMVRA